MIELTWGKIGLYYDKIRHRKREAPRTPDNHLPQRLRVVLSLSKGHPFENFRSRFFLNIRIFSGF